MSAGIIIGSSALLEGFLILCFYSLRVPLGLTTLLSSTGSFGVVGIGAPYILYAFGIVCLAYFLAEVPTPGRLFGLSTDKTRTLVYRGTSIAAVVLILGALATSAVLSGSLVWPKVVWLLVGWLIVAVAFLLIVPRVLKWRYRREDRSRTAAVLILCCVVCILGLAVQAQTLIGPRMVTVTATDGTASEQVLLDRGDSGLWLQGPRTWQVRYVPMSSVAAIDYK